MALLHVDFFSESLMRTVSFNAVLPTDKTLFTQHAPKTEGPYKALYLLHGGMGNHTDWISGTRIQAWVQDRDLAVIMPAGENKFFVDNEDSGEMFGAFIGKELVDFTRRTFPLSHKRADTFIAGLSMGGYGAVVNGLKYHETFGAIGALSAAFMIDEILHSTGKLGGDAMRGKRYFESIFGDLDALVGSDKDYHALIQKLIKSKADIPGIYMACGTEDFILGESQGYHAFLSAQGVPHTYEEGPGGHEWPFWDTHIKQFIDWLPLGETAQGIGSGHVRPEFTNPNL